MQGEPVFLAISDSTHSVRYRKRPDSGLVPGFALAIEAVARYVRPSQALHENSPVLTAHIAVFWSGMKKAAPGGAAFSPGC